MSTRTPLVRWLQRTTEKLLGTWREGPEPPKRLDDLVIVFARMHPHATRRQWVEVAQALAREAYRTGFVRGYEHAERDPEEPDVEAYAAAMQDGMRLLGDEDGITDPDADEPVPDDFPEGLLEGDAIERARGDGRGAERR